MKKQDKSSVNPEVYELYDDYAHNRINRRSFISELSALAAGGLTVPSLLSLDMNL